MPTGYQYGDYVTINLTPALVPVPGDTAGGNAGAAGGAEMGPPPPSEVEGVLPSERYLAANGADWTLPVGSDGCVHERSLAKLVAAVRALLLLHNRPNRDRCRSQPGFHSLQ